MNDRQTPPSAPGGYRLRTPAPGDADAVAALRRAVEVDRHGHGESTSGGVLAEWSLPGLAADDVAVIEDETGAIVAYGVVWMEEPPDGVSGEQVVHPAHRSRGLVTTLLRLQEARVAELARVAPGGGPMRLAVWAPDDDAARLDLYARRGYERVRTLARLDRDLTDPVEPPRLPPGVAVRHFRRGRDEAAVHAATEEAYRDHFRTPPTTFDDWADSHLGDEHLDTGLWLVAWAGDEIAAGILAYETAGGGHLDELFVRRPWRGRGLARALLLLECAELRRRGHLTAFLAVDTANAAAPATLYASVGFRALRGTTGLFEKDIPGV